MDPGSAAALVNSVGLGISLSSLVKKHLPTHKEYLPGFPFGVFPGPVRPICPGMPPAATREAASGILMENLPEKLLTLCSGTHSIVISY
jgi:hypothetical protein